ncbi:MAG: virus Omega [Bacteroidota bacterium]|jgi:cephalosporin hydroxylase
MKSLKEIYLQFSTQSPIDGGDKGTVHSYIDYYEESLKPFRDNAKKVLEIGINNGHSLMMWNEYFYNADIIGVDLRIPNIDINCLMIQGDATDPETFRNLNSLDVIVDDGSHKLNHQLESFEILFPLLNDGGIYIIEDIVNIDKTEDIFLKLSKNVKIFDFRHIKNRSDDVIVQIIK